MGFIFRETFRAIRRTPGTWAMNVLTLAVALSVSGLFGVLAWKVHSAMKTLRANLAIEAFFDPSLSSEAAAKRVDDDVKILPGVQSVMFTSREQALTDYTKMSGENVESVLGMNPLPASVTIRLSDPSAVNAKSIEEKLRQISGVADVRSDVALIATMERRAQALDTLAIIAGALLVLTALFYTVLTSRFILTTRADGIHTLTLLGATRMMIFGPEVIEAGLGGVLGGLLAAAILVGLQHNAVSAFGEGLSMVESSRELAGEFLGLGAVGLVLGMGGTMTAMVTRRRSG